MDLRTKLYQMFILGVEGGNLEKALSEGLGGVIFFTKDIKNQSQFKNLVSGLRAVAKIPPFLSIDQEGGRVERTENIHNGKKYLSAKFAFEKGKDFLKTQTEQIAKELVSYGLNLNFAPCIDVNTNPDNPIIGERAFSSKTEDVIEGEKIVSETYRKNGIIPCAKHFPGHGDANADSHLILPEITLDFKELEEKHILPFKKSIENGIETIMAAHLHVPHFESERIPTSLSKNALSYLRNELNFKGIIISDDMVMKGIAGFELKNACEMGIRAGLNVFVFRNSKDEIINMIDKLAQKAQNDVELKSNIEKSYELIVKLKKEKEIW